MSNKVAKGFRSPSPFIAGSKTKKSVKADRELLELEASFRKYQSEIDDAYKALGKAEKAGDSKAIAGAYSELLSLHLDVEHPDLMEIATKSVEAATDAYGADSMECANELSLLATAYICAGDKDSAIRFRDAEINIVIKHGDNDAIFSGLELGILNAEELGMPDKIHEYALRGIALVKERCSPDSEEYTEHMSYFEEMRDTAFDAPISKADNITLLQAIAASMRSMILCKK